jgi:hypothetical protein
LPDLVIEDGLEMARHFFAHDPAAQPDGYDDWVAANNRDRFERRDVEVINGAMRARASYTAWGPLYGASPGWLRALAPHWDLVEASPGQWASGHCRQRLCKAIEEAASARGVGPAIATKVLHLKRPRLVPILDSLVIETVGGNAGENPTPVPVALDQLRIVALDNGPTLSMIQDRLELRFVPSKTRILDAILWTAHPRSPRHAELHWPTRIGPK